MPDHLQGWRDLCASTRVGGRLPVSFRVDADRCDGRVTIIATTTNEDSDDASRENELFHIEMFDADHMPEPDVSMLHHLARAAYLHELGEFFTVDGERPYHPHPDGERKR
jgi:hypothetical protein